MQKIAIIDESIVNEILLKQELILKKISELDSNSYANEFISISQASDMTGMSEQKLYQMVNNGEIEFRRFGKSIRIVKNSLLKKDNK